MNCRTIKIGNKKCCLSPLIGCPFGSLFQVETGPKGPYLLRLSATEAAESMLFFFLKLGFWVVFEWH